MLLEALKIAVSILGGGAAGALMNEWFRRRSGRLQPIPLIERVNRLISPELKGFALARVVGNGDTRQLEEIQNVREYQFTLRNTSTIHLHDAEVQFEFPSQNVEAWAERPVRSKTAPMEIKATATSPWRGAFRWRIPEFPASDSIEFTFRVIDPPSGDYEVALYNGGQVVIQRSKGEPPANKSVGAKSAMLLHTIWLGVIAATLAAFVPFAFWGSEATNSSFVSGNGCSLEIASQYNRLSEDFWPWKGPWEMKASVRNIGNGPCIFATDTFGGKPRTLAPGDSAFFPSAFSETRPKLAPSPIAFGTVGPTAKSTVRIFQSAPP